MNIWLKTDAAFKAGGHVSPKCWWILWQLFPKAAPRGVSRDFLQGPAGRSTSPQPRTVTNVLHGDPSGTGKQTGTGGGCMTCWTPHLHCGWTAVMWGDLNPPGALWINLGVYRCSHSGRKWPSPSGVGAKVCHVITRWSYGAWARRREKGHTGPFSINPSPFTFC